MATTINADTVTGGLIATGDATGELALQSGGTTIVTVDTSGASLGDSKKILLGDGDDLQLYHDGSNSYIKDNGTGQLVLDGNAVLLQYASSTKLGTTSGGVAVTGGLSATSHVSVGSNDASSNGVLYLYGGATGEGGEIRLYASADEDTTVDNWSIDVATDDLRIFNSLGDLSAEFITNGGVKLYYDNSLKLQTTSTGVSVTGQLSGNVALTPQVITTNTTGSAGNYYFLNSAGLTLTLPASPSAGDVIGFSDVANDATHTIGRNGNNIMGDAADMTVDTAYQNFTLMYTGATVGWAFAR